MGIIKNNHNYSVQIICFFFIENVRIIYGISLCKGGLWFLSPKDEWDKAQRAQYNEFVLSGLKS